MKESLWKLGRIEMFRTDEVTALDGKLESKVDDCLLVECDGESVHVFHIEIAENEGNLILVNHDGVVHLETPNTPQNKAAMIKVRNSMYCCIIAAAEFALKLIAS